MRASQVSLASIATLFLGLMSCASHASDRDPNHALDRELDKRELAQRVAPVKSKAELVLFNAYARHKGTPLERMPAPARQRFLESLVFSETGLASFEYTDLMRNLTPGQIQEVLAIFGAQHSVMAIPGYPPLAEAAGIRPPAGDGEYPVDYADKVCSARASCTPWSGGVCIGNNC
ncbi:hypothetical protein [Stenotrophomonas maltophilia]|uniref:hypothetical protein n=1 Tax=Stenotrophomonas maltophilia TaxID=40324 RepID=UPI00128D3309|nr:hypothetical protein [Stenotrophomonas maltophilia]